MSKHGYPNVEVAADRKDRDHHEVSRRGQGRDEALVDVGHKELKKNGVPRSGFAKFRWVKKPATKARKGTNPFTGEEMMFKAKPARKIVRASRSRRKDAV